MSALGDYKLGTTVYDYFTTAAADTGAPTTLSGTPVVSVYEDNSDTQITSGVTLGVDADSTTGLNRLTIVATSGNGFEVGKQYTAVITTGTVGGTSAVGYVVSSFSIEKTGLNLTNTSISAGPVPALGIVESGTLQSATSTTAVLRSATSFANDLINSATLVITGGTGVGQQRVITDWVSSSDTATVDTWTTTPDNTSTYLVLPSPPVPANTTTNITGSLSGSVGSVTGNVGGNVTGSVGSVVGAVGSVTGNVGGNVTGSVGSVVGAVGSVTGNVGGNVVGSVGSVTGDVGGLAAGAITDATTAAAAALTAAGITAADGITKIAGETLVVGGSDPASPIGVV